MKFRHFYCLVIEVPGDKIHPIVCFSSEFGVRVRVGVHDHHDLEEEIELRGLMLPPPILPLLLPALCPPLPALEPNCIDRCGESGVSRSSNLRAPRGFTGALLNSHEDEKIYG